ncbi:MAG TPA: hypothetical protein VKR22_12155 [Acidimicrobiales bacterium]|nr:hypothetical protein [Acidimicrobiales bacterium]
MAGSDAREGPGRARSVPAAGDDAGVEANARLTAALGAVLLVLLAAEGVTIVEIRPLLTPHVFIGMLLLPAVLVKMATTGYRFARYYIGAPAYRRKGPPPLVLRLFGPFVVASTLVVLASGIALLVVPEGLRRSILFVHKASFVLWFGLMTVHVLGHLLDTARLAPRDWVGPWRRQVRRATLRQWVLVSTVAAGIPLGLVLLDRVGPWLAGPRPGG